jgi:hypothetical protein
VTERLSARRIRKVKARPVADAWPHSVSQPTAKCYAALVGQGRDAEDENETARRRRVISHAPLNEDGLGQDVVDAGDPIGDLGQLPAVMTQ